MMDEPKFAQPIPNVTGKLTHTSYVVNKNVCIFNKHVFMEKNTLF